MVQGRGACLALVGDDEDECDVSCCHLARYQDPGDHPDVAMSYSNIQCTRRGAWSARKGARDANTRVRPRALDVADSYQNIGIVYHHQENKVEATEMYTKACRIFHKVLGPDHPASLGLKRFVKVD